MKHSIQHILRLTLSCLILTGCSTISLLKDGEVLFTGLESIDYHEHDSNANASHLASTKEEIEAALATTPNGAFFGSSYYRTPFPYGLWIWNAFSEKKGAISKWLTTSFGKPPVLMSNVNPTLRASVADNVLAHNGYFNGKVTYSIIEGKPRTTKTDSIPRPRTAKVKYHVDLGHLYTLDSIGYSNYPEEILTMIKTPQTLLKSGDAFSITSLDNERTRIYDQLRNHGYYFYQPSHTTYFADTLIVPGRVQLQLHLQDSLPDNVMRKWVIGTTTVQIKRAYNEEMTDSVKRRFLTLRYNGRKSPLRPRVVLADTRMYPGMVFSQDNYQESLRRLAAKNIYSSYDIIFTPRKKADGTYLTLADSIAPKDGETRAGAGVLDMTVNAILDKPYDFTFEADAIGKTSGRLGPGITVGLTKRNAFRGGEILNITAGANYEFQTGGEQDMGSSYDFSLGANISYPRLLVPKLWNRHRRWFTTPSTLLSLSAEIMHRAGFFNREMASAEFTYVFQPSANSVHKLSPFILTYGRTFNISKVYSDKALNSVVSTLALRNELTPKMRYTYTYRPVDALNPLSLQITLSEAGNFTGALYSTLTNKKFNDKDKRLFSTPFSQFIKLETEVSKTWTLSGKSSVVLHFYGGILSAYGNNAEAPFSEKFYIGGANDLRGFSMRSLGPGEVHFTDINMAYLMHTGDTKLVLNAEYRPHMFGSLYGALFVDMGNVWSLRHSVRNDYTDNGFGDPAKKDIGIDAGIGIRYDLDFFVLRLDWGFALHNPYSKGFFNCGPFHRSQVLNFAIGYPF